MKLIVDANVLIDYGEGTGKRFFREAMRKGYAIHVLENVYAEARFISPSFHKIKSLISELLKHGIYNRVKATAEEKVEAAVLKKLCYETLGYDLDRTDRRILAIAKNRGFSIVTGDRDMKKLAKKMKLRVFRHFP